MKITKEINWMMQTVSEAWAEQTGNAEHMAGNPLACMGEQQRVAICAAALNLQKEMSYDKIIQQLSSTGDPSLTPLIRYFTWLRANTVTL